MFNLRLAGLSGTGLVKATRLSSGRIHTQQMRPPVKILAKVVITLTALAVLLSCVGASYQVIGTWRDARRFPQRGRTVQAGNVRLNIDCSGNGSPTIILDSGMGVPAMSWRDIQSELTKFSRVCSYDRAGYGWSEVGPKPRTSQQIAHELRALLDAAKEKGPYIMVGHSFGGYNVRVFTGMYPADVLGMVLVDAEHGDEERRIGELLPASIKEQVRRRDNWNAMVDRLLTPLTLHLGIDRLKTAVRYDSIGQEYFYLEARTDAAAMAEKEVDSISWEQVKAAGNLGNRPLIVLTAGKPYDPDPLLTNEQMERQNRLWINDLQAGLARLSTHGKQIVVPDSGHMIPLEQPDAVVSAIREVWSAVRKSS
jgi:pimeloyl-ACP methyl ester carboxylesterase